MDISPLNLARCSARAFPACWKISGVDRGIGTFSDVDNFKKISLFEGNENFPWGSGQICKSLCRFGRANGRTGTGSKRRAELLRIAKPVGYPSIPPVLCMSNSVNLVYICGAEQRSMGSGSFAVSCRSVSVSIVLGGQGSGRITDEEALGTWRVPDQAEWSGYRLFDACGEDL